MGSHRDAQSAFLAMCLYCRNKFSYTADGRGVTQGLRDRTFNCSGAADLVVGVLLKLSGEDLEVSRFLQVFEGNRPTLTPVIERPGVTIENNVAEG